MLPIDGVSRGRTNAWSNAKGSHSEAAGVVSWHAVDLDLLLHLPALHWLSTVRSTEEEVNSGTRNGSLQLMDPMQLHVFLSSPQSSVVPLILMTSGFCCES